MSEVDEQSRSERLRALAAAMAGKTALVVGDVMLDEYITGRPTRISREAPVPVLELESKRYIAGGAANPAANIVSLGGRAIQAGVVGDDAAGARLTDIIRERGINAGGIITCHGRPTTVKTRILAQMGLRFPQQLARIDTHCREPLPQEIPRQILDFARGLGGELDAALLSHYQGSLLTAALVRELREICAERGILITADAQGEFDSFRGLDAVKCNADDASRYLGAKLETDNDFGEAALALREALGSKLATVITRGGQGATLALDGEIHHCPAPKVSDVFDTVGAGDTAIAAFTLALACGSPPLDALTLANYASGIVVRHLGNYAPTQAELLDSIDRG